MTNLKTLIKRKAKSLGATLVGFTNVARYREYYPDSPTVFHPDRISALGKRQIPGSSAFVPGTAGLILAGEVVRDIAMAAPEA